MRAIALTLATLLFFASACGGEEETSPPQTEDTASDAVDATDSASSVELGDAGDAMAEGEPGADDASQGDAEDASEGPCQVAQDDYAEALEGALACSAVEECSRYYLGPEDCGCSIFVNAEADLDPLFALHPLVKEACGYGDVVCPAIECPVPEVSCDEGRCVNTFPR